MKTTAVIPAYNEEKRIAPVIENTKKYVDEVIVIDDMSKDATYETALKAGAIAKRHEINLGAGGATRTGAELAIERGADIIITLDADGQHNPAEIPKLVKEIKDNNIDIVYGCRPRNKNMPFKKRIGNWGLTAITNVLFFSNFKDTMTGYHVFTKEAYPKLKWESNRYGIVSEFAVNTALNKLKFKEVEVETIYVGKEGGMNMKDAVRSVFQMLGWRFTKRKVK